MQLFKHWAYRENQDAVLSEEEIALRLAELWLTTGVWYSCKKNDWLDYVVEPTGEKYKKFLKLEYHTYIQWDYRVDPNDRFTVADGHKAVLTDTTISKQVFANESIKKNWEVDITKAVSMHMWPWTLFVVWVDSYVLHGKVRWDNEPLWGHVVVTTGIQDWNYIVYDPGPAAGYGIPIPTKQFEDAFLARWEGVFVQVTEKDED